MAIGPGIYREKYKDYSIDELKKELKELQEHLYSDELKKERQDEIERGIDDNNCVTNVETEIEVVKELINCKEGKNSVRKTKLDENSMRYDAEECKDKISNEDFLKNIVEKVVGNNDPFWNQTVYEIVKKIINLSVGDESSITKLLGNSQFTSKQLFEIYHCVNKVCRKIGIILDFSRENSKVDGLPYNLPFIKKDYIRNTKSLEKCLCGNILEIIWSDNQKFQMVRCPKCNNEMKFKNPILN